MVRGKSTELIVYSGLRKHFIRFRKKLAKSIPVPPTGTPAPSAPLDIGVASIKKVPIPTPTNPYRSTILYEPRVSES